MLNRKVFFVLDSNLQHQPKIEHILNTIHDTVSTIRTFGSDLILTTSNNRFIILDSNFNQRNAETDKLNALNTSWIISITDTILLGSQNRTFSVSGNYKISNIKNWGAFLDHHKVLALQSKVYSDSMYNVFACSAGEWGGSIFFEEKKSGQVYSLPCFFNGIFKYQNDYYLIESHGYIGTEYLKISDPKNLFKHKIDIKKGVCCNCAPEHQYFFGMSDSVRRHWEMKHEVDRYLETMQFQHLDVFTYKDQLYSLCMDDSSFLVVAHKNDTVEVVDRSVWRHGATGRPYHFVMRSQVGNKTVLGLNGTFWSLGDSMDTQVDNLGMITISGNKINIYQSKTTTAVKLPRSKP